MHVYKELTQPTTVSHSLVCNLLGGEPCLVVVRGHSLLQLYTFKSVTTTEDVAGDASDGLPENLMDGGDSFIGTEMNLEAVSEKTVTKLVHVAEWPLDGYVLDIRSIRTSASEHDCLLVAYKHAKLALLTWDKYTQSLSPISIHFYEKEMFDSHFVDLEFPAYLKTDPRSEVACFVYQRDQLVFLPFIQADLLDDTAALSSSVSRKPEMLATASGSAPVTQPSVLISASKLDERVQNIVSLEFLYEYNEPTLAILYQTQRTWTGTLPLAKDTVNYLVLSVDLSQGASTAIVTAENLPYDTYDIVPLRNPIKGVLLVGTNQLIHVDPSGKASGVAVNPMARLDTNHILADQSDLNIRLEQCRIVDLDWSTGEMLLVLHTGELYIIKFQIEGRKVHGFKISKVATREVVTAPTTAVRIDSRSVFLGSNTGNAKVLGWLKKGERSSTTGKVAVTIEDDIDDIYGDGENDSDKPVVISCHDELPNYGPIASMAVGRPKKMNSHLSFPDPSVAGYDIVTAVGADASGSLCISQQTIRPVVTSDLRLSRSEKVWALSPRDQIMGQLSVKEEGSVFDSYLITSDSERSVLYKIENKQMVDVSKKTSFEQKYGTLFAGLVLGGTSVVQVTNENIMLYDSEFNLCRLYDLDRHNAAGRVVSISIQDPYVLLSLDDNSYVALKVEIRDEMPTLAEVDLPVPSKVCCGALTSSLNNTGVFGGKNRGVKRKRNSDEGINGESTSETSEEGVVCAFIVEDGKQNDLILFNIENPDSQITIKGIDKLPTVLSSVPAEKPAPQYTREFNFKQIVITQLGDATTKDIYIALLTDQAEFYLYKLFTVDGTDIRFTKEQNIVSIARLRVGDDTDEGYLQGIRLLELAVGDYSALFVSGECPLMVLKNANGPTRIHRFGPGAVSGISKFNTEEVSRGFAYADGEGVVRIGYLDADFDYGHSWPTRRLHFGETINNICYHEAGQVYALSTMKEMPYDYVDEDGIPIAGLKEDIPKGNSYKSTLKLLSPLTWTIIDEKEMEDNEVIMTLKTVVLTLSEKAKRKKEFLSFGTSILRGEDLAAKGTFYVYDAIGVVPEPGKPETDRKLKEVAQESVKGAVTALCDVEGHLLIAQGQKVVVRNLQEDNSIIPVAFLDLNMYIVTAKAVKNFLILGDALRSVWLAGFGQEPYRMATMGKDMRDVEISSADFSINNGRLSLIVADTQGKLQLLEYDPEDPSSLSGQKLLCKSEFFTGRMTNCMGLVPMFNDEADVLSVKSNQLFPLCGSDDGTLSAVIPVSESAYRTLYVLQQQIIDKEEQVSCLNPRMHRETNSVIAAQAGQSSRAVLDYGIVSRFAGLDAEKRYLYSRKMGRRGLEEAWRRIRSIENSLEYM
ncbi:protein Cft1p [Trichomonascus vanleenenianus]|uniref:cleavage/polyadenylation factor CFT1 n=1 Tax=Trichomonascus vanleenenianus TaxID=2268995 RepID=UPI003ECBA25B